MTQQEIVRKIDSLCEELKFAVYKNQEKTTVLQIKKQIIKLCQTEPTK